MSRVLIRRAVIPTSITWTEQSNPAEVPHLMYFTKLIYDPVSARILSYLVPNGGANIYASSMHAYVTLTNDWTYLGGSSSPSNNCSAVGSPSPWPRNRHPCGNFAIDTLRNRLWLGDGVCSGVERDDCWYYALNADPTSNTWTQVSAEGTVNLPVYANMVYATTHDILVSYGMLGGGNAETWVYCPAASVTADQIAAGCLTGQTWYRTVGPAVGTTIPNYNEGWTTSMFWDVSIGKVIAFTKDEGSGAREIWLYDVLLKTWTQRIGTTGVPSDVASLSTGDKDHVLITSGPFAGNYLFHRTSRTAGCDGPTTGYVYNASLDSYTQITTVNVGPPCAVHLAWDESADRVVSWGNKAGGTGEPAVWQGVLA